MIQRLEKVLQDAGGPYRAADWFRDQAADWSPAWSGDGAR